MSSSTRPRAYLDELCRPCKMHGTQSIFSASVVIVLVRRQVRSCAICLIAK